MEDSPKPFGSFSAAGRTALVTGAGRNVGRGVAEALAASGAAVAVNDIDPARAAEVVSAIEANGGAAVVVVADVTDPASVAAMVAAAETALGPIDVLVNNAGIPAAGFELKTFREMAVEDWDQFIKLNLYGVLYCTHAVVEGMCSRGWGRIVTVSSEAWRVATPVGISMYAASKAGAIGFMRQLSAELGATGVTANCVALGEMDNLAFADELAKRYPTRRLGTPADVAAAILYLVSDEASWITGQVLPVNGGLVTA